MRFQCPECQRVISVDDELCGHDIECADCSGIAGIITTIHVPIDRLSVGSVLGDFVLIEETGRTDGELTFAASQISLDRPAVVKVLRPELATVDEARDAFIEAARESARKPGAQPCEPLSLEDEDGLLFQACKAE